MDLNLATSVEFDTALMNEYLNLAKAQNRLDMAFVVLHRTLGHRRKSRNDQWTVHHSVGQQSIPVDDKGALSFAIDMVDAHNEELPVTATLRSLSADVDAVIELALEVANIELEIKKYDEIFISRGGWSRYFSTEGTNFHFHDKLNCSSCHKNGVKTRLNWNPELSGATEKEAVDKLGPRMCTICYPSAPVAWTHGEVVDPDTCKGEPVEGSVGDWRVSYTWKSSTRTRYGTCGGCGLRTTVNEAGKMRKHKPKK